MIARPIASDFRSSPGPLVVVTPSPPPNDAPERGADAGDLVLGLERTHPELLPPAELVEDVGRLGDRVSAQEERQAGQTGGDDQAPGQRLVAGDLDVLAVLEGRGPDLVGGLEELGRLAEVEAGLEGARVGLDHLGRPAKRWRSTRWWDRSAGCRAS